mgnify:CR=1 FL=1
MAVVEVAGNLRAHDRGRISAGVAVSAIGAEGAVGEIVPGAAQGGRADVVHVDAGCAFNTNGRKALARDARGDTLGFGPLGIRAAVYGGRGAREVHLLLLEIVARVREV